MKNFVRITLVVVVLVLAVGFYLKSINYPKSAVVIGIGVLLFAFVLLPSFLYHRYKDKNIKDYTLDKEKMDEIFNNLRDL